jgi:hypothetical protein
VQLAAHYTATPVARSDRNPRQGGRHKFSAGGAEWSEDLPGDMRYRSSATTTRMRPLRFRRSREPDAIASARSSAADSLRTRCPPPLGDRCQQAGRSLTFSRRSPSSLFSIRSTHQRTRRARLAGEPTRQLFQPSRVTTVNLDKLHRVGPSLERTLTVGRRPELSRICSLGSLKPPGTQAWLSKEEGAVFAERRA